MDTIWKEAVWQQLGAAIDMLENAMLACPEDLWSDRSRQPEFWYMAFHTLFFLDYYLSETPDDEFVPPAPFTLDELDPAGVLPELPYTKEELLAYLRHGRGKARTVIAAMTEEEARRPSRHARTEVSRLELLIYNQRHVQHHAAQLNLLLRQAVDAAPRWVGRARSET